MPNTKASDASYVFYFICAWIHGWVNNREAGDLRRHRAHYDVIVMGIFRHWSIIIVVYYIRYDILTRCFDLKFNSTRHDRFIHSDTPSLLRRDS